MADVMTLSGGTTGTLNLLDLTKYVVDGDGGDNIGDEPIYLEIYAKKPDGGRRLARRIKIGDDFTTPIIILGSTYQPAKANLKALRDKIDEAAAFELDNAGTAVMLNLQFQDETVADSRKVVGGHVTRSYKLLKAGKIDAQLVLALSDS